MRVIVVDDERLVQLGIQTYLQQAGEKFEIGGVFANGRDALNAMRRQRVEVLLTDIKMPVMDGLELIARARQENLAQVIIVLSCHDEFDLVRRAFTNGADEYVLKHEIEQNQLIDVLQRQSGAPRQIAEGGAASAYDEWGRAESALDPGLPVICGTYRFKHRYDDAFRVVPWKPVTSALDAEIDRVLARHGPALHLRRPRGPLLLFGLREVDEVEPHRRARRAGQDLIAEVRRYWNREMQIWISPRQWRLSELADHEGEAQTLRDAALYTAGDTVSLVGEVKGKTDGWPAPPRIHLGDADAPDTWCRGTQRFLEEARRTELPPSELRLGISGMLHQIDRDLHAVVGRSLSQVLESASTVDEEHDSLLAQLEHFDDLEMLQGWLESLYTQVAAAIAGEYKRRTRLGKVLEFIDERFQEPLRLTDLADRFSISRTYLCSRFREETGMTFSQYLNRRRIDRAQEMLASSDMTAKEISFHVGYENPNYFSRVFKAYTGESVSSYRNERIRNM
ncbi:MAG: helix-turn-helix domain-containing protein [Spirochaetes bacterium]|jgi:two-component system response regulator YesN|nr:helix-turn-helix domain-containing protein [Spirochaetota bacterium]